MDMRTGKYSEEQIIGFLRQSEAGMPIKKIGRKHCFSDPSFYKGRSKYGGMDAREAKRLREQISQTAHIRRRWGYPRFMLFCAPSSQASSKSGCIARKPQKAYPLESVKRPNEAGCVCRWWAL